MSLEGVDYDDARPGGKALAAAGKRFACRYLQYRGNPDPRKPISLAEIGDLFNNGISIVANFESTSNRMLDGAAAGAADATDAKADLKGLGFPDSCPVYFSADFDPQPQYLARIDAYLSGASSVLGKARVGIYGGIDALTHTRQAGTATWFWMAAGWDHGRQPPAFAHIWQYQTAGMGAPPINGASVDLDRALKTNYGQYDPPGGAGPAQPEEPMTGFSLLSGPSGSLAVPAGSHSYQDIATGTTHPISAGTIYPVAHPIHLTKPINAFPGDRQTSWLVTTPTGPGAVLASDGTFTAAALPHPPAPTVQSVTVAFSDGTNEVLP